MEHMRKSSEAAGSQDHIIDFGAYLRVIKQKKWSIFGFALIVSIAVSMIAMTLTPKYLATATLLIESSQTKAIGIEEVYGLDSSRKEYYLTQFEVLKSNSIAREVIEKLNLAEHPDFISKPSLSAEFKNYLKGLLPFLPQKEPDSSATDVQQQKKMLGLVAAFQSRLTVNPIRKTQLVHITFESSDPELAALVANTVGEVYIDSNMRAKMGITKKASDWLNVRLSELRIQLDDSEARLQEYRESQELIDIEGVSGLINQELEQTSQQLVVARNEKNNLNSINRVIAEYGKENIERLGSMPEITSHRVIQDVKREMVFAQRKVSELGEVYGPKHPKIISAKAELATVTKNLHEQIMGLVAGIEKELNRSIRTVKALEQDVADVRARYQDISRKETDYNQLKREVDTNRTIFNSFLSRSKETEVTSDFSSAAARFTDRAFAPLNPSKPNKKVIVLLTFVASLGFAMIMALIFDSLNDTIKSKADIENRLMHRMLGLLPLVRLPKKANLPIHAYLQDGYKNFAEAVRTFRTGLILTQMERNHHVIAVTSTVPGEGKTTTSANLAMSLGQLGKVLLIDADLRKPSICRRFDIPAYHPGLSNLIIGTEKLDECIFMDKEASFMIMPSGPVPSNPLELLASERFTKLINSLKNQFDYIVIDTPPTQAVSDPLVIAQLADAVVYVVKSDSTRIKAIKGGLDRLFEVKANIAGVVLNQVDVTKDHDGSYQGYYDYYDYGHNTVSDPKKVA